MTLLFKQHDMNEPIVRPFDFTRLNAFATCPRYGGWRYVLNKVANARNPDRPPNMALQAGSAAHDVFAGVRLLDALEHNVITYEQFMHHGAVLFGEERFLDMTTVYSQLSDELPEIRRRMTCLNLLDTFGYINDDDDRNRSFDAVYGACRAYIDRWQWGQDPIWVEGPNPTDRIGVEVPFAIDVLDQEHDVVLGTFVGRIDGMHVSRHSGKIYPQENKTGKRINDVWEKSFITAHQVTGYIVAARLITKNLNINAARVIGLQIPQPARSVEMRDPLIVKHDEHFHYWSAWLKHVLYDLWLKHEDDDFVSAPMYTHSCSRYFSSCEFTHVCALHPDDIREALSTMTEDRWSPLD